MKGTNNENNNNNYNNAMTIIQMGIGWFERLPGKLKIRKLLTTPPCQVFLNDSAKIQRALFSYNKSEQLHSNNDFFKAVEIALAPSAAKVIILLLLLSVCSPSVVLYRVGGCCYSAIIDSSHSSRILKTTSNRKT